MVIGQHPVRMNQDADFRRAAGDGDDLKKNFMALVMKMLKERK